MLNYEQKIKDIINAEIKSEVESRIKNYPIYVMLNGGEVALDIESVDISGGEINIILEK